MEEGWRDAQGKAKPRRPVTPPPKASVLASAPLQQHCSYANPTNMADQSIKSLFSSAERQRKDIEASWDSNTATYQQNLAAAITAYENCLKLADRLSLFSTNETLEDLTSGDLQYVSTALLRRYGVAVAC